MNVLFLTVLSINDINASNIYADLMRTFIKNGDTVRIVCPTEGAEGENTNYIDLGNESGILRVKTDRLQKVSFIRKGISTITIESKFKNAIKKYLSDIKFDLILYSTPPITLAGAIEFVKKRDRAKTYLLLKDIFPQNAVDIGLMTKTGAKSVIYKMFRAKETKLYALSDFIGCMSKANVDFVIKNNPEIQSDRVHISPNTIEIVNPVKSEQKRREIRKKYAIPQDVTVFVYGGNLGRPQDIPFVISCLKANQNKKDRYFVICGTGTDYHLIEEYVKEQKPDNVLVINGLPKAEYDDFINAFDVGLIFLDSRFTIPNFPSRLLAYMQSSMPVISCTDKSTDIGDVIENGGFGFKCFSDSTDSFTSAVEKALKSDLNALGQKGYEYLENNYTVDKSYEIICSYTKK